MQDTNLEKPRLLDQSQGFSFLNVQYKEKLLYSKYNPEKNIQAIVEKTTVLPGTLVILFSPVLFYGTDSVIQKLTENCVLCAFEADKNLFELSLPFAKPENIPYFNVSTLSSFDEFIRKQCRSGKIRRAVSFSMSAAFHLNADLYDQVFKGTQEIITSFWKNRITLQSMARLCSRNIIKNLMLPSLKKKDVEKTVSKPILVLGAGESLEELTAQAGLLRSGTFFIIASDASLKMLQSLKIKPDAVCILESRHAVVDFFTGTDTKDILLITDLTSRTETALLFEKRYFFLSDFTDSFFLKKIKEAVPEAKTVSPLGSVGLFAVMAALFMRKTDDIPVYVSGLDFSFTCGKTHSNGTLPHEKLLSKTNRFFTSENCAPSFMQDSFKLTGKNGRNIFTTKILNSYAELFVKFFSDKKNLFDVSSSGLSLGIPAAKLNSISEVYRKEYKKEADFMHLSAVTNPKAGPFLKEELSSINEALSLLENGEASPYFKKEKSLSSQIENLLKERDYLYIHFPDGTEFSMREDFLKRIKAELLFFKKQLTLLFP